MKRLEEAIKTIFLNDVYHKRKGIIIPLHIEEANIIERKILAKVDAFKKDVVCIKRRKLQDFIKEIEVWYNMNQGNIASRFNLHSHSGISASELLQFYIETELLGDAPQKVVSYKREHCPICCSPGNCPVSKHTEKCIDAPRKELKK